eukprot:TRINITY_DN2483_c0_g1_i2.p1 TRINITY_DN2483_c0_g1~~TRINITY_DN2483_c0_g1_i2.p1  ORF type:complete len:695 (+),score=64.79 TRINITY_DN2483_c0_g1_i2:249-2333(+)
MGKAYVLHSPLDGQGTAAWLPDGCRLDGGNDGRTLPSFLLDLPRPQGTITMKLVYRTSGRCGKNVGDVDSVPVYLPSAVSTALKSFGVTLPVTCPGWHQDNAVAVIRSDPADTQNIAARPSADDLTVTEREEHTLYMDYVSTCSIGYQPSMQSWLRECCRSRVGLTPAALSLDVTRASAGCYVIAVVRGKQILLQVGMENDVVFYPSRVSGSEQYGGLRSPLCRLQMGRTRECSDTGAGLLATSLMDALNTVHWGALQERLRSILVESSLSSVGFGFSMDFLVVQAPEGAGKTLFLRSLHRAWQDDGRIDLRYCDMALDQDVEALLDWCRTQEQCHGDISNGVVYLLDNMDLLFGSSVDRAAAHALEALQSFLSLMHSTRARGMMRILGACRDVHELPRQIRDDIHDVVSLPALSPSTIGTILTIFLETYIYPARGTKVPRGPGREGQYNDIIQATKDLTRGLSLRALHQAVQLVAVKCKGNDDDADDDDDGLNITQVTQLLVEALRSATSSTQYLPRGDIGIITWEDILGYPEVKQRLLEAIQWPLHHSESMARFHLPRSSGILLYGPSGCGKSYVTRALSHKAGVTLLTVSGSELLSKYLGESEKRVRQLFEHARSVSPCLLCFDQLDTLARTRQGNDDAGGNDVHSRVLTQLLTEMDGVTDRGLVFVIACTSRPDLIDPAMLRPGRLDQHM